MKYEVFIDIPLDEEWEDIAVISREIEADNPEQAMEFADVEISQEYEDYYIWEVSNDDIIEP